MPPPRLWRGLVPARRQVPTNSLGHSHPPSSGQRGQSSCQPREAAPGLDTATTVHSSRDLGATSPETCHLSEMTLTLLPTFSFFSALAACLQIGCHTSEPETQQRESVSAHPCC